MLMGSAHYTRAIDVWSIGCIFSELFRRGNPLFKGNMQSEKTRTLEIDQIRCIFKFVLFVFCFQEEVLMRII